MYGVELNVGGEGRVRRRVCGSSEDDGLIVTGVGDASGDFMSVEGWLRVTMN